jgi:UDP-N-acetylglucosamine 3-dehydrogenase
MKYAVIGTGNMGKNHARTAHEMPELELVAVADANLEAAQRIAKFHDCAAYEHYQHMLDNEAIEAVSVCVPTTMHLEVATACMQRGKHVLLEKPIAPTLDESRAIQQCARASNVQLMVGHIERFNPAVQKTKELIMKGEIGEVVTIMARRVGVFPPQIRDANIAVDLAIHDLDIISFLLDAQPTEVMFGKKRNHIELREDSVEFFLRYPQATAYVQANWITPVKIRKLNITGTEGYLEMDYMTQKIQFYKSNYEKFRDAPDHVGGFSDYILKYMEPDLIEISVAKREPLKEEIRYFIRHIRSGETINTDFAVDALAVALQA